MNDIEKYINGELDPPERQAFQARLEKDPVFREEVGGWQSVAGALMRLHIADKVKEVDAARSIWLRKRLIRRIITGALLAGLAGLAIFIFLKKQLPDAVPAFSPQDIPQQQGPAREQVSPEAADEKSLPPAVVSKPIADGPKNKNNATEKPLLRSVNPELDYAANELIDLLLNMTESNNRNFTSNTFYDLNPEWKKCVLALRQGNPLEAKKWIYKMDTHTGPGMPEARWLMGIALLEEGKTDEALSIFEQIAGDEIHPRQKDALTTVVALRR